VAAPITISITADPLGRADAIVASDHGRAASTITGANAKPLSLPAASARRRAARRHPNNCCGVNPCRRATAHTDSPLSPISATIRAFCSAVHSVAGRFR
jgi:hypothetical protein